VRRGQVLSAPNAIKSYKKFKAEVHMSTAMNNGRHLPFFAHYRCVIMIYGEHVVSIDLSMMIMHR